MGNKKTMMQVAAESDYQPTEKCENCRVERNDAEGWHYDAEGIPFCDACWNNPDIWKE